jgi:hypothetical protein
MSSVRPDSIAVTSVAGGPDPVPWLAGPVITAVYSPQLGQALAAPSNEKQQPQKHATSVIVGSLFFLGPVAVSPADR